ncbi:MAG: adenylate/guanylate cyclase domain-containing protein [Candidatus Rifleibacteriota bacterium]
MSSDISVEKKSKGKNFVLEPLSLWKWFFIIVLLLCFPLIILFNQMVGAMHESADRKLSDLELELEKVAGRAVQEQEQSIQINEILKEYEKNILPLMFRINRNRVFLPKLSFIPFISADQLNRWFVLHDGLKLSHYHKKLEKLIPGIEFIYWDSHYKKISSNDKLLPKFVYSKLIKSICLRLKKRQGKDENSRGYKKFLPMVSRYFGDDSGLIDFVKYGKITRLNTTSGKIQYLYWQNFGDDLPDSNFLFKGFLAVIKEEKLPTVFGLSRFKMRRRADWQNKQISLGWIDELNQTASHLPYPFSITQQKFWRNWISSQPDGVYRKNSLLLVIKRLNSRLIVVSAKSIKDIEMQIEQKKFLLFFVAFIVIILAVFVVFYFRSNNGAALSIKWQMLGLFCLAMALPMIAVFHFGNELVKDRAEFYENQAYKKLERVKKEIEENVEYVFRHIEVIGDDFIKDLCGYYKKEGKKRFAGAGLNKTIDNYFDLAGIEHLYLFNAAGEELTGDMFESNEREGLLPLVKSLAKLKLRLSGQLVEKGYAGAVSLMDLMIEETGGAQFADIQTILGAKEGSAFELKFTGRRTLVYVGQFSPLKDENEVFILVFIIKDRKFDELYLQLMIDKFQQEAKIGKEIQVFYGKNDFHGNNYFRRSNIKNPLFDYTAKSKDATGIGKITEPTRFAGVSLKDSYRFSNGKKVLLYSFIPSGIESYTVMALHDYSSISERLQLLKILILIILLVSILIVYVLVKITGRSFIQPVQLLKQTVQQVEEGNYDCRISLPGKDELVNLGSAVNLMTRGLNERERMTRYLSKSAVEAVKSTHEIKLGGRRVPASILFSDIRSFTTMSESYDAEEVVALLNDYFAKMNMVIEKYDGDIDKFIGDAIMAQFISKDEPGFEPETMALKAVKAGMAMMDSLKDFNQQRELENKFPIMIGVGINSGEVIAGNIGSPGRMDHTVIGDTVNVASRLEGMSKKGRHSHVIISSATLELVKEHVEYEKLQETSVKGKTSVVEMFEIISIKH